MDATPGSLLTGLGLGQPLAAAAPPPTSNPNDGPQLDSKGFKRLLDSQSLVDCTLACDGGKISAHKIVLSICSSYLNKILQEHPVEHPIIILPELNIEDVRALVHYMYTGELLRSGSPGSLHSSSLLKTAAFLSVNSLYDFLNNAAAAAAAAAAAPPPPPPPISSSDEQTLAQANQPEGGLLSSSSSNSSISSPEALLTGSPGHLMAPLNVSSAAQAIQSAAASLLSGPFAAGIVDNLASLAQQQQQQPFNGGPVDGLLGFPFSAASLASLFPSNQQQLQLQLNQQPLSEAKHLPPTLGSEPQQIITGAKGHQQTINMSSSNMVVSASSAGSANGASKSEFQFRCPVCLEFFHTICSFEYHMQKSHNVTSFGCEICHKPFASLRYVLTDHMRRCHGWRPDQQQQASANNQQNTNNTTTKF